MFFANDARFPFTYSPMFRDRLRHVFVETCWDRVPFFFAYAARTASMILRTARFLCVICAEICVNATAEGGKWAQPNNETHWVLHQKMKMAMNENIRPKYKETKSRPRCQREWFRQRLGITRCTRTTCPEYAHSRLQNYSTEWWSVVSS